MRNLAAIDAFYAEIDTLLERQRAAAEAAGDATAVKKIEEKQIVNDQAYFVLSWGQLEAEIDEKCRAVIRKRRASRDWNIRRAWELFNPDDRRLSGLSFEERTALVLDKTANSGESWARISRYYQLRNQIAHGTLSTQRIEVTLVIADFYNIQSELQL
jgi:hypothetical protein